MEGGWGEQRKDAPSDGRKDPGGDGMNEAHLKTRRHVETNETMNRGTSEHGGKTARSERTHIRRHGARRLPVAHVEARVQVARELALQAALAIERRAVLLLPLLLRRGPLRDFRLARALHLLLARRARVLLLREPRVLFDHEAQQGHRAPPKVDRRARMHRVVERHRRRRPRRELKPRVVVHSVLRRPAEQEAILLFAPLRRRAAPHRVVYAHAKKE